MASSGGGKSFFTSKVTPSPQHDRNVRQKTSSRSSDDESNDEEQIDDELCAKFKKIKGKNKKTSINKLGQALWARSKFVLWYAAVGVVKM